MVIYFYSLTLGRSVLDLRLLPLDPLLSEPELEPDPEPDPEPLPLSLLLSPGSLGGFPEAPLPPRPPEPLPAGSSSLSVSFGVLSVPLSPSVPSSWIATTFSGLLFLDRTSS